MFLLSISKHFPIKLHEKLKRNTDLRKPLNPLWHILFVGNWQFSLFYFLIVFNDHFFAMGLSHCDKL
jgi:hypothetical protein